MDPMFSKLGGIGYFTFIVAAILAIIGGLMLFTVNLNSLAAVGNFLNSIHLLGIWAIIFFVGALLVGIGKFALFQKTKEQMTMITAVLAIIAGVFSLVAGIFLLNAGGAGGDTTRAMGMIGTLVAGTFLVLDSVTRFMSKAQVANKTFKTLLFITGLATGVLWFVGSFFIISNDFGTIKIFGLMAALGSFTLIPYGLIGGITGLKE